MHYLGKYWLLTAGMRVCVTRRSGDCSKWAGKLTEEARLIDFPSPVRSSGVVLCVGMRRGITS
jgi:hypothetical protein